MWKTDGKTSGFRRFEATQADFKADAAAFLTSGLEPLRSDQDMTWLLDKTCVEESVAGLKGDEEDKRSVAVQLYSGFREYREIYGRDPEPGQMAAVGAALRSFPRAYENGSELVISESAARAATSSSDFTALPQFMLLSALAPLRTISSQLGHSVGFVSDGGMEVYEAVKKGDRYGLDASDGMADEFELLDAGADRSSFSIDISKPVTPGSAVLFVDGQRIGADGAFQLQAEIKTGDGPIALQSYSVDHWDENAGKGSIAVQFAAELPANQRVAVEYQVDVERYPEFLPQIGLETRFFTANLKTDILTFGMSLRAALRSMRNIKRNLPDLGFQNLVHWLAAAVDRKTLRGVKACSHVWNEKNASGKEIYAYRIGRSDSDIVWTPETYALGLSSFMAAMDKQILSRQTNANLKPAGGVKGGANIWIGGAEFKHAALTALSAYRSPISKDAALSLSYPDRPCYLGELHGRRLFYSSEFDGGMTGVSRGALPSESAFVLGAASPIRLMSTDMDAALRQFMVAYFESVRDFTPDAGLFLNAVPMQTDPEVEAGPSVCDPFGLSRFI